MGSLIGYTYTTTVAEARASLAVSLNDPTNVFWGESELNFYLQEAIETWNCYARYFKTRGIMALNTGSRDISVLNIVAADPLGVVAPVISLSTSARKVLQGVLLHLLEINSSAFPAVGSLTGHISSTLLQDAFISSLNQLHQETGFYAALSTQVVSAGESRVTLPSNAGNVLRAEWRTLNSTIHPLTRTSKFEVNHWLKPQRATQRLPESYSIETSPAQQIDISPTSSDNGTLAMFHTITQELSGDLFTADQNFFWPSEWWWVVKYATLGKILSTNGPTLYPQMAEYYLRRAQMGVELMRSWTYLESAWIDECPIEIAAMGSEDLWRQAWRTSTSVSKLPRSILMVSANRGYIDRTNTSDPVSITVDTIRDSPTLTDSDPFPIAPEYLDYVLDYAQHLAVHKCGGQEFSASTPLLENFHMGAQRLNDKLQAGIQQTFSPAQRLREQRTVDEVDVELSQPNRTARR